MPSHVSCPRHIAAATIALLALLAALSIPASAGANADIRVVTADGTTLAEHRQYTHQTVVKTDPGAECFGKGSGGSGEVYKDPAKTAAGQLFDAARNIEALRPIGVSDAFSFGLAICEIAGIDPSPSGFWEIRVNHASAQVGADQVPVNKGDDILWYEVTDFTNPPAPELALQAKPRTTSPTLEVTVLEHDPSDGSSSPAVGATVTGAALPTNAQGKTTVALAKGKTDLAATRAGSIPSNTETVCRADQLSECSSGHDMVILGTRRADKVRDARGDSTIKTGNGADRVVLRDNGSNRVFCGRGKRDKVIVQKGDTDDRIAPSCERVKTV